MKITCNMDSVDTASASSLIPAVEKQDDTISRKSFTVEKTEGSYFGEWTLLGERMSPLNIVAVGDIICSILTKDKFDSVVGPLAKLSQDDHKYVLNLCFSKHMRI